MKRNDLISAIRTQADFDESDLSNDVAVLYLTEAFHRTAGLTSRWPSCEADWVVSTVDGAAVLDTTLAEISSVRSVVRGKRLVFADHDLIMNATGISASSVQFFSLWAGKIFFWPEPADDTEFTISGWRRPSTAWLSNPSLEVDLDERLHLSLFHYAMSLLYAQQEDIELENSYMRRWDQLTSEAVKDITRGGVYRPIVLNGGLDQQVL